MDQSRLYNDILRALSLVLDIDEGQKLYHAWRVGLLSFRLAQYMDLPNQNLLFTAGLLHDIGGVGLADHLVHHTTNGFKIRRARAHPQKGVEILRPIHLFHTVLPFIADHHEHFDGSGFPSGKKGTEIPIEASIVLMADILELQLRSHGATDRQKTALTIAQEASGKTVDPQVADATISLLEKNERLMLALFDNASLQHQVYAIDAVPLNVDAESRQEMLSQLLWLFARIIDVKNVFSMGHSARVTFYAKEIIDAFANEEINQWDILWAGLLHDVGIVGVPGYILEKTTLTDEENRLYEQHAKESVKIISTIHDLAYLAYPAASHHEWYNGNGYPEGKAAEHIPLLGRTLAFADTYDALTGRQGFGESLSHQEAIDSIRRRIGTQFDPHIAPIALDVLQGLDKTAPKYLDRIEAFQQFFKKQDADIGHLLIEPGNRRGPIIMADRGLYLGECQPWHVLELSSDLEFINGKKAFIPLTIDSNSNCFTDFLDTKEQVDFRNIVSTLRVEDLFTRYFITTSGHPLEIIISAKPDRYRLLYRSAAKKIDPLKRMSLLHRNFMTSSEGTVFLNPGGNITDANHSFLTLYGYHLEELNSQKLTMLKSPRQPMATYEHMWQCLNDEHIGTWSGEMVNQHKNGETIIVILTINALFDSNGIVVGYIGQHHDITQRKKQEEALRKKDLDLERKNRELEKLNQLKSDLMAITSHDLKSPITAMIGYADLIKTHIDQMSTEKAAHYLEGIIEAGNNQLQFISDLLDLYQFESNAFVVEKKPMEIEPLLQKMVKTNTMAGRAKEVRINLTIDKPIFTFWGDSVRIEQVLNNLISNAIKFSPVGACIDIHCKQIKREKIQMTIDDQGPGIAEQEVDLIFDRYYQVKKKDGGPKRLQGIGLGLYISKNIVSLHDGLLYAENRPKRGCRFTMEVPLLAPKSDEDK